MTRCQITTGLPDTILLDLSDIFKTTLHTDPRTIFFFLPEIKCNIKFVEGSKGYKLVFFGGTAPVTSQGSPKCTNVHFAVHLFLQVILHFLQMNSINRNWFNETCVYDSCCLIGPCILLLLMWLVATFSVGLLSHHLYMTLFIAANVMKKWTNWTALMKRHALPIIYCTCLPLPLSRETRWENNMGWGMTGSDSSSECNTFKRCISLKMHLLHQQCSYTATHWAI